MNDIQKSLMDLLKQFLHICDELNLKYYLVNGCAIGAAKYSGFIPWDDDVDVALPRKDYEIFCEKAQSMLPEHCFLQNYHTDPNFPQFYSKIRNSNTTFIEDGSQLLKMNHGCYIDIFPLDEYPKDRADFDIRLKILNTLRVCALNDTRSKKIIIRNKICRFFGFHNKTANLNSRIDSIIKNYGKDCDYWRNFGDRQAHAGPIHKSVFGNGIVARFEDIDVIIPEKYDEYLTSKYGKWREDLPEEEKHSHHCAVKIDLHRPYTDYIGE